MREDQRFQNRFQNCSNCWFDPTALRSVCFPILSLLFFQLKQNKNKQKQNCHSHHYFSSRNITCGTMSNPIVCVKYICVSDSLMQSNWLPGLSDSGRLPALPSLISTYLSRPEKWAQRQLSICVFSLLLWLYLLVHFKKGLLLVVQPIHLTDYFIPLMYAIYLPFHVLAVTIKLT